MKIHMDKINEEILKLTEMVESLQKANPPPAAPKPKIFGSSRPSTAATIGSRPSTASTNNKAKPGTIGVSDLENDSKSSAAKKSTIPSRLNAGAVKTGVPPVNKANGAMGTPNVKKPPIMGKDMNKSGGGLIKPSPRGGATSPRQSGVASGIKRPTTSTGMASSAAKLSKEIKRPSGLAAPTPTKSTGKGLQPPSKVDLSKKKEITEKVETKIESSFKKEPGAKTQLRN